MGQKLTEEDPFQIGSSKTGGKKLSDAAIAKIRLATLNDVRSSLSFALHHLDNIREYSLSAPLGHIVERLEYMLVEAGVPALAGNSISIENRMAAIESLVAQQMALQNSTVGSMDPTAHTAPSDLTVAHREMDGGQATV